VLNSFVTRFDYLDLEKKLKHYFSDTAPIYADVELRLKDVRVSYGGKLTVQVSVDDNVGVKENISRIIKYCEQSLYPKMLNITELSINLSEDRIKEMLFQGYTLDQIHEKQIKKAWNRFTITKFNTSKNSIDYFEESTGKLFRAHIHRPLITFRDTILRLANSGQDGMQELYHLIIDNSQVEEIEEKDASVSTNSDRYK
jgi:hypothetical protein